MRALCLDSTWAILTVLAVIVSSIRLTDIASMANSSLPSHSRRGQSTSLWCSPRFLIASVIFVRGFRSTLPWNQKIGSTRTIPTTAMKNVKRPSAERVTLESDCGSETEIIVTAFPAMSRSANTASYGLAPRFQNPPE